MYPLVASLNAVLPLRLSTAAFPLRRTTTRSLASRVTRLPSRLKMRTAPWLKSTIQIWLEDLRQTRINSGMSWRHTLSCLRSSLVPHTISCDKRTLSNSSPWLKMSSTRATMLVRVTRLVMWHDLPLARVATQRLASLS